MIPGSSTTPAVWVSSPTSKAVNPTRSCGRLLVVLRNMDHRGGQGADMNSGDGAGILLQLPHTFLVKECAKLDIELPQPGHYAVGFMFLPPDVVERENTQRHFEKLVTANGQELLGWRNVPVDPEVLGEKITPEPAVHGAGLYQGQPTDHRPAEHRR